MLRLNILCSLLDLGKCLSISLRKVWATLVDTFLLNGGLNHIMLRCLFLRLLVDGFEYLRLMFVYPLLFKASSYSPLAALNISSFDELRDNLPFIDFGSCFIIWVGGLNEH